MEPGEPGEVWTRWKLGTCGWMSGHFLEGVVILCETTKAFY